jgi:hypothetical protein
MKTMLRFAACAALTGSLAIAPSTGAIAAGDEARDLVRRVLDAVPKASFVATLNLSSKDFDTRVLRMHRKYVGGAHGSYLEVISPENLQGIRFLFLEHPGGENEQYIKVAASRRSVRVSDEIRRQPFLGSAFYVSDLVMPDLNDYTYRFVGEQTLLGRPCKLVEMVPKRPSEEIYGKTVLALDPKDLLILRRQFFDRKGDLFKVWTIDKVEKIDGNWTLREQEMANVKDNTRSLLEVAEIEYGVDLPDLMFTPKYLLR